MEAICSSDTSVDTQRTTRRCSPEDCTLRISLFTKLESEFDSLDKQMCKNDCNTVTRYVSKLNRWNVLPPSSESKGKPRKQQVASHLIITCLAYSTTLKMEAVSSAETSIKVYQTTWLHIPENSALPSHRRGILKYNRVNYGSISVPSCT
jgi:hypothetical protein